MSERFVNLSDIFRSQWFLDAKAAEGYYPTVLNMIKGGAELRSYDDGSNNKEKEPADKGSAQGSFALIGSGKESATLYAYRISSRGQAASPEMAPPNSVAILSFQDVITKHDQWCGPVGMQTTRNLFERACSNPNIVAFVFEIDSPGGDGHASAMMRESIKKTDKPVVAFVEGMAASAAYWLASRCDEIFIGTKQSSLGSIGCYVQIADFTEYYAKEGIKVFRRYAPESTLKNKGYEDALKDDYKSLDAELSEHVQFFIADVKAGRPGISSDDRIFKGAMFSADTAISLGLADKIGSIEDAVRRAYSLSQKSSSDNNTINSNSKKTMSLFNKLSKVSALSGLETVTKEQLDAANEQLTAEKITAVALVSAAEINAANKNVIEVERLTKELGEAKTKIAGLEEKVASYGSQPGEKPTSPEKKEETPETNTASEEKKFEDYDHNKEALETLKNI